MQVMDHLYRFFLRFRYPVTLPEDIADALGIHISNYITFDEFVSRLTCPSCQPTRLSRFMPREKAEHLFHTAQKKERFRKNTLFSYYFNEGWMEFVLQFDEQSRLRRIYLQHKLIKENNGIEIPLKKSLIP